MAQDYLKYQLPSNLESNLGYLFNKAEEVLESTSVAKESNWRNKVGTVFLGVPMIPPAIKPRIFKAISDALFNDKKLRISYYNNGGISKKDKVVSPLGLVQQENRLYLVCLFDGYEKPVHVAVHRVSEAQELSFAAEKIQDFSLNDYIHKKLAFVFGSESALMELTILFRNPIFALNMKESPLSRSQTIEQLPNGVYKLRAVVADTIFLKGWIESWKEGAEIIRVRKKELEERRSMDPKDN